MSFRSGLLASLVIFMAILVWETPIVESKKPTPRPRSVATSGRPPVAPNRPPSSGRTTVSRRRRYADEDEDDDEDEYPQKEERVTPSAEDFDDEDDLADEAEIDDDDEEDMVPRSKKRPVQSRPPATRGAPPRSRPPPMRSGPSPRRDYYEDAEDEYDRPPRRGPPRRTGPASRKGRPGSVVPYTKPQESGAAAAFTRGLSAIREAIPDPANLRDAAVSSIAKARETTSSLTTNLYREVKGLTSSELEQVMLKATKPDDTPVKGKHVERLVGVTYQISSRYDIYDAVLRKLWGKMIEKDWRTTMKSLYILHRFSADGAPEHAAALKARLRELRRTKDPKRKDKFFNSKQLLAGDVKPDNIKFRAFMARYAHYVLLRAQCFGGMFDEIAVAPKLDKKKPPKPITATCLRVEHLDAAALLLKAGLACMLKEGEECENTAIPAERVAADLIGLTTAVASALNRVLKEDDLKGADPALLKRWCAFYSDELLPQTKTLVKKITPKLDAYGLFLPSRMGASVPRDLLEKGLTLSESSSEADPSVDIASSDEPPKDPTEEEATAGEASPRLEEKQVEATGEIKPVEAKVEKPLGKEETAVDDDYEYDEEEYYDDDEEEDEEE